MSAPGRGLIYRFDYSGLLQGCWDGEPDGERYAVVISPAWLNDRVETVIVAPTTASRVEERSELLTNVLLVPGQNASGITRPCVVQLHLLTALNVGRLGELAGEVFDPDTRDDLVRSAAFAVGDAESWVL